MLLPIRLVLITLLVSACSSLGNYQLEVGGEVRTQRGFFDYQGTDAELLSHTIAVGHPGGVSYVYDLETGRLAGAWDGGFIDARGMWHGRGRGGFSALGDVHFLGKNRPLHGTGADEGFRGRGYSIEESSGLPNFHYDYGSIEVTDRITPLPGNNGIEHSVTLSQIRGGLSYELVTAGSITEQDDGSFVVDDGDFIIEIIRGGTARIEGGGSSLVLAVTEPGLSYTVRW